MKRRSIFGSAIAVVASLAIAGSALGAFAGIGNGSFENGTITPMFGFDFQRLSPGATNLAPWTVSNATVDWIGTYWQAEDGTKSVDLDGNTGDNGALSQTFATTIGNTYVVGFWMSGNPDALPLTKTMTVQATGGPLTTFSYTLASIGNDAAHHAAMNYVEKGYSFLATSTTTTLTFTSTTDPSGYGPVIDNVDVTETVPTGASCKNGGWKTMLDTSGNAFKNQGDCVSFFATDGRNLGDVAP